MIALLLSFLGSSTGRFVSLAAGAVVAVGVSYGAGFYKGDKYRATLDAGKGEQEQIDLLQREIAARDAAAKQDASQSQADRDTLAAQLERANAAITSTPPGPCLDSDDVKRLRSIWAGRHGKH